MLEAVVGTTAALLVILGLVIALGPTVSRRRRDLRALIRRVGEHAPPAPLDRRSAVLPGLHPTTQRAVQAATRLAGLLRTNGYEREAADLKAAARQAAVHEAEGLRALQRSQLLLQHVRLEDEVAYMRFRELLKELRQHVGDRAEQLELLPF